MARQSAHIVLSDDNFVSIVNAVREGRRIFHSIKKFVVHVLATNVGMTLLLMVGLAFRDPANSVVYPQSALEILLLNVFVLSVPLVGLVMEPPDFDVMAEAPRRSRRVLTAPVLTDILIYGVFMGACAIAVFTAIVYGVNGGLIGVNCNSSSTSSPTCEPVLRARGATFMIIYNAFNCRHVELPGHCYRRSAAGPVRALS